MFASKDTLLTRPSGGYTIARSVRLRSSATAYFNRTFTTPTNQKIWTWSGWIKRGTLGSQVWFFGAGGTSNPREGFNFLSDNTLDFTNNTGGSPTFELTTTQVFRDPSAWYHIVIAFDSTQATASNRIKMYVNGTQVTAFNTASYPSLNANAQYINSSGTIHNIGALPNGTGPFDGYLTEINFIDGQALTPSSFGSTNAITGVWQPAKYTGTYGTNGFYLNFSDNSSNTSTTIGKDYSGNGNNWTPNNISVTAGATYDSMQDVPTLTSATAANYAVMNPLNKGASGTGPADGNLSWGAGGHATCLSTIAMPSGKWYAEFTLTTSSAGGFGITSNQATENSYGEIAGKWWIYDNTISFNINSQTTNTYSGASRFTTNQVWQVALDITNGKCFVGVGNSWVDSAGGSTGNPSTGANPTFTFTAGTQIFYMLEVAGCVWAANFGQRAFTNTPPTGYVALNTYNLPASTITNGAAYMAASLYTGTNANLTVTNTVNGTGMQPDLVWMKIRSTTASHVLIDSVRGVTKTVNSDLTNAESTSTGTSGLLSFNSNGFSLGTDSSATGSTNGNGNTYVGWQWKAGTTSVSNTNGTITSTVSAGATQGFSVVTYTGNSTSGATVGHGLGVAPSMIIVKARGTPNGIARSWFVYHIALGGTKFIYLDLTNSVQTGSTVWNDTNPSNTVFTLGNENSVNMSANNYVAYCFSAVAGYSAFGSYTGNGSADGPFVYCGFRPRYILVKCSSSTEAGEAHWECWDTSRTPYNVSNQIQYLDLSTAESTSAVFNMDILSNGFKLRPSAFSYGNNASGQTYIYAAFAEVPFKSALGR